MRPRQISDEEILEAARACFLEEGPSATVATIGARLGVSHAAILQRMGTKRSLFREAMMPSEELEVGVFSQPPRLDADRTLVEQLVGRLLELYEERLQRVLPSLVIMRCAGMSWSEEAGEQARPLSLFYREHLELWLDQASDEAGYDLPPPTVVAEIAMSFLESWCFYDFVAGRRFLRGALESRLRGLFEGLRIDVALKQERRDPPSSRSGEFALH